uniref:Uncharacterized protein n=1 Tax=Anguilla anguilla TaxID=7936 RepID=A0A0E9X480_ANGAN
MAPFVFGSNVLCLSVILDYICFFSILYAYVLFVSLGAGSILRILCFSIRFTSLHLCCNDTLGSLSQNSTAVFYSNCNKCYINTI